MTFPNTFPPVYIVPCGLVIVILRFCDAMKVVLKGKEKIKSKKKTNEISVLFKVQKWRMSGEVKSCPISWIMLIFKLPSFEKYIFHSF